MQSLVGTALGRVNRQGLIAGALYSEGEVRAALRTHRYQVFRYELHRIVGGVWGKIADIDQLVKKCTIKYDRWGTNFMGSADFTIVNDGSINFLTDRIRCFHLMRMPDGYYVEWMKGTFYIPSPEVPLNFSGQRDVNTQDGLRELADSKITDWFTVPSPNPHINGYDDGDPLGWVIQLIASRYPPAGVLVTPATTIRVPASEPKFYEPGTPIIDVCNDLLLYANYDQLRAEETGSYISHPFVNPSARPIEYTYIADADSVIIRGSGVARQDLWNATNQWLRYKSRPDAPPLRSRRTITDPTNILSTAYRGRTVTDSASIEAPDQATLDAITDRLYEEGQRKAMNLKIETPLMPHWHQDKAQLLWTTNHPWASSVNGVYILRRWTFPMIANGRMNQEWELVSPTPAAIPTGLTTTITGFGTTGLSIGAAD